MERKKAADFPPEVLRLFDGYVHGTLSRRAISWIAPQALRLAA